MFRNSVFYKPRFITHASRHAIVTTDVMGRHVGLSVFPSLRLHDITLPPFPQVVSAVTVESGRICAFCPAKAMASRTDARSGKLTKRQYAKDCLKCRQVVAPSPDALAYHS